jgi:hypothetical protein
MLDKKVFFQRQIEECRELLRHAVIAEDRAFWLQAAERGKVCSNKLKKAAPRKKSEDSSALPNAISAVAR